MAEVLTQPVSSAVRVQTMKKLEVIIKPGKLDAVKKAIEKAGYMGVTISQVEGHGTQKGLTQKSGDGSYRLELLPKIRVEIVIPDSQLEAIVEAVSVAARTGQPGDGKIFVSDVKDVIRIRTGERGEKAI
jgi:nitrogen regulatory protein P-II 1